MRGDQFFLVGHDKIDGGADPKYKYNVKVQMAIMELPCCIEDGDVRGLCFTCIGDLDKMTLKQLAQLRTCPNLCYAMAYWLHNNHYVSCRNTPGFTTYSKFLEANPELAQYIDIVLRLANITRWELTQTIYDEFVKDSDSDSDSDSDDECETCGSTKHVTSKSYGAIQVAQCKECWLDED